MQTEQTGYVGLVLFKFSSELIGGYPKPLRLTLEPTVHGHASAAWGGDVIIGLESTRGAVLGGIRVTFDEWRQLATAVEADMQRLESITK